MVVKGGGGGGTHFWWCCCSMWLLRERNVVYYTLGGADSKKKRVSLSRTQVLVLLGGKSYHRRPRLLSGPLILCASSSSECSVSHASPILSSSITQSPPSLYSRRLLPATQYPSHITLDRHVLPISVCVRTPRI